ncbi:hypothetical protein BY458DRAFT_489425 [Sporodiniella umbellata]|nr:hypothetical protein BY458DRAFT_489425 [Sporodiniella umbellata]
MRSSFLALVIALAASANAKTVNRNGVSMDVSACTIELNNVGNHLSEVAVNLSGYTKNLAHAMEIQAGHLTLEEALKIANKQCSKISGSLSPNDSNTILEAARTLSPHIETMTSALVDKKGEIAEIPELVNIVLEDVRNTRGLVNSLTSTLYAIFPEESKETATTHIENIHSAIDNAEQIFLTL